jgi:hypothetical protein
MKRTAGTILSYVLKFFQRVFDLTDRIRDGDPWFAIQLDEDLRFLRKPLRGLPPGHFREGHELGAK